MVGGLASPALKARAWRLRGCGTHPPNFDAEPRRTASAQGEEDG